MSTSFEKSGPLGEGRTMDRMFDLSYFEKRSLAAHRRLGRWR